MLKRFSSLHAAGSAAAAFADVAALGSSLCIVLPALAQQQNPPNLIFMLSDDQGTESIEGPYWDNLMGCYTTYLDQYALQGVSFTNCRVNPNCSPTRAALMTGRSALDVGVNGVLARDAGTALCSSPPLAGIPAQVVNRLSLQTQERTIAEVLHDMGYYTILVDKWHLGHNADNEDLGLLPTQQGFDEFFDWKPPPGGPCSLCDDYDDYYADTHMLCMAVQAVNAVNSRPDPNQPYALFFWTTTPHARDADPDGYKWWKINPANWQELIPRSLAAGLPTAPPTSLNRFIMNVEAMDSVIQKHLLGPTCLNVVNFLGDYNSGSNTIIFFASDNGTDKCVSWHNTHGGAENCNPTINRAKNSLYEGGIHVPLIVFGAGITGNMQYQGTANDRQITHLDFFDTICDIIRAPDAIRNNPVGAATDAAWPRRSMSFADAINWADPNQPPPVERTMTIVSHGSSHGPVQGEQAWRVAIVEGHYKLMCSSGGTGTDDMTEDRFFDLNEMGQYDREENNLLTGTMSSDELTMYYKMRDDLCRMTFPVHHASVAGTPL